MENAGNKTKQYKENQGLSCALRKCLVISTLRAVPEVIFNFVFSKVWKNLNCSPGNVLICAHSGVFAVRPDSR